MVKTKCDHFWEVDINTIQNKKPTFTCMKCGAVKKDNIPILDPKLLEDDEGPER